MFQCVSVSVSPVVCVLNTERGETGEPAAHERVQDEGTGLRRPAEDGGEGAERRPAARSAVSVEGQNGGQRHAGHPGERSCKDPPPLTPLPASYKPSHVQFLALMIFYLLSTDLM